MAPNEVVEPKLIVMRQKPAKKPQILCYLGVKGALVVLMNAIAFLCMNVNILDRQNVHIVASIASRESLFVRVSPNLGIFLYFSPNIFLLGVFVLKHKMA